MSLINAATAQTQVFRGRSPYVSGDEAAIRQSVEDWGRIRWPDARCCHELVVNRGDNRADVAFISPRHFVTVEIKSKFDGTARLIPQVAAFRLASPETWLVIAGAHGRDAKAVKYLIPSIGVALAAPVPGSDQQRLTVLGEPTPFQPLSEAMLSVLWVEELRREAQMAGFGACKGYSHAKLVAKLLTLSYEEQIAAVCRQLRRREAIWRADPPIEDRAAIHAAAARR